MVIFNLPWFISASTVDVSQRSHWLLSPCCQTHFLPLSCFAQLSCQLLLPSRVFLTSLFQISFLKMFYLHSFASFPFSFPLPLPLNCTAGLQDFNRPKPIFTNSLQSLSQSFTFWPHFSPSCWLCVVICSSHEPCCCLPSVLFALTLVVLFSDPHQVLSDPLFSPDADLLQAHGPNLHILTPCKHINDKMLPGVTGSKLHTSPWSGFYKNQTKLQRSLRSSNPTTNPTVLVHTDISDLQRIMSDGMILLLLRLKCFNRVMFLFIHTL